MSDAKLRELERRWLETGAVEDEAAWLRERVRVGALDRAGLLALAYRQVKGALAVLGDDPDLRLRVLRVSREALAGRPADSVKLVALTSAAPISGFLASLGTSMLGASQENTPIVVFPLRDGLTSVGRSMDHATHESSGPWEGRRVFMEQHQWDVRVGERASIRDARSSNGSWLVRATSPLGEPGGHQFQRWVSEVGVAVPRETDPSELEEGDVVVSCYAAFVFGRPWRPARSPRTFPDRSPPVPGPGSRSEVGMSRRRTRARARRFLWLQRERWRTKGVASHPPRRERLARLLEREGREEAGL